MMLFVGAIIFFSCKKEIACDNCKEKNKPPISLAGPDQVITLPTDSVSLDGKNSSDPDGKISEWLWKKFRALIFYLFVINHLHEIQTDFSVLIKKRIIII